MSHRNDNYDKAHDYNEWYYDDALESLPYVARENRAMQSLTRYGTQFNQNNPGVILTPVPLRYDGRVQYGINYAKPYNPDNGLYYKETLEELENNLPNEAMEYLAARRYPNNMNKQCHTWFANTPAALRYKSCGYCGQGNCNNPGCPSVFVPRDIPNLTPRRLGHECIRSAISVEDYVGRRDLIQQQQAHPNKNKIRRSMVNMAELKKRLLDYSENPIPWWERHDDLY